MHIFIFLNVKKKLIAFSLLKYKSTQKRQES